MKSSSLGDSQDFFSYAASAPILDKLRERMSEYGRLRLGRGRGHPVEEIAEFAERHKEYETITFSKGQIHIRKEDRFH